MGGVGMPHIPEADGAQRVNYGLEANSFKTRLCGNQKHNGWQCFLYLKQDTINNNRLVLKTLWLFFPPSKKLVVLEKKYCKKKKKKIEIGPHLSRYHEDAHSVFGFFAVIEVI